MALSDGLIHYWPMDETSGTLVEDVAGDLGFAGIVDPSSTETIIDSATGFGKARNLAAPADGAYLDLYTGASDGGAYSLSVWTISLRYKYVAITNSPSDYLNLFWQGTGATENYRTSWFMRRSTNIMSLSTTVPGQGLLLTAEPTADLDDGSWYRVTLTFDGTTVKMYHGAELANEDTLPNTLFLYPKYWPFYIGADIGTDLVVDLNPTGIIDDVSIWNRAITPVEIESPEFQYAPVVPVYHPPDDSTTTTTNIDSASGTASWTWEPF